jgi:hypothetical protein
MSLFLSLTIDHIDEKLPLEKPHFRGPPHDSNRLRLDRLERCRPRSLGTVPGDCDATEPRHLVGWYYHRHGIYLPNTDQQIT